VELKQARRQRKKGVLPFGRKAGWSGCAAAALGIARIKRYDFGHNESCALLNSFSLFFEAPCPRKSSEFQI
jgi:hypothetical protein